MSLSTGHIRSREAVFEIGQVLDDRRNSRGGYETEGQNAYSNAVDTNHIRAPTEVANHCSSKLADIARPPRLRGSIYPNQGSFSPRTSGDMLERDATHLQALHSVPAFPAIFIAISRTAFDSSNLALRCDMWISSTHRGLRRSGQGRQVN